MGGGGHSEGDTSEKVSEVFFTYNFCMKKVPVVLTRIMFGKNIFLHDKAYSPSGSQLSSISLYERWLPRYWQLPVWFQFSPPGDKFQFLRYSCIIWYITPWDQNSHLFLSMGDGYQDMTFYV